MHAGHIAYETWVNGAEDMDTNTSEAILREPDRVPSCVTYLEGREAWRGVRGVDNARLYDGNEFEVYFRRCGNDLGCFRSFARPSEINNAASMRVTASWLSSSCLVWQSESAPG